MIPVPTDVTVVSVPRPEPWMPAVNSSEAPAWRLLVERARELPEGSAFLLGSTGLRHEKSRRRMQVIASIMQAYDRPERSLVAVSEHAGVRLWVQDGNIYLGPLETN